MLLERLPEDPRAAALPRGDLVEVDPASEQKLVLLRDGGAFQRRGGFARALALAAERPIRVAVQRAPRRVRLAPPKVVDDVIVGRADPDPTVELDRFATRDRDERARAARGDRDELLDFAVEEIALARTRTTV